MTLALSILLPAGPARADNARLEVCNQTNYTVWVAIGWTDGGAEYAEGWFRVDPGACTQPVGGKKKGWYAVAVDGHLQWSPWTLRPNEGNFRDFCVHVDPFGPRFNYDENDCNQGDPDRVFYRFGYLKDLDDDGIAKFRIRD